ncbi:GNAT family N-acetyltransferase [Candidatus Pacearchaeota archaeon]|nr:GNAT family N-acetyltransferase [Candidatus Pacearchaeota archaeon]
MELPTIQGESFLIRAWSIDDTESLCENANNINVAKNLIDLFPHPYAMEDARFWIKYVKDNENGLFWAIDVSGKAIGTMSFFDEDKDRNYEVGYWIGERYWGRGITTNALRLALGYVENLEDAQKITSRVFRNNLSSVRVLEKNGFVYSQTIKNSAIKNGVLTDEDVYVRH